MGDKSNYLPTGAASDAADMRCCLTLKPLVYFDPCSHQHRRVELLGAAHCLPLFLEQYTLHERNGAIELESRKQQSHLEPWLNLVSVANSSQFAILLYLKGLLNAQHGPTAT